MTETWWIEALQRLGPTGGALVLAAALLFLLRIPQSSRLISHSYERVIKQLRAANEELHREVSELESKIDEVREESREALATAERNCDERIATLERLVETMVRNRDGGKNR